jgi:hypothetical protein
MRNKIIAVITILLVGACGGYYFAVNTIKPQVVEIIKEKKITVKNTEKNKITTKPDGTIIKETTSTKEDSKIDRTSEPVKTKYSAGVKVHKKIDLSPDLDYTLEVGKRIKNSDLWIEGGYRMNTKEISLGVKFEF